MHAQIEKVRKNDYNGIDNDKRGKIRSMTEKLHEVSQTIDSGMANVEMSLSLTNAMNEAFYRAYPKDEPRSDTVQQIADSIHYLTGSWQSQKNWLVDYRARKDTAMGFVGRLEL